MFISKFYEEVAGQPLAYKQIKKLIGNSPLELIDIWNERLDTHLKEL